MTFIELPIDTKKLPRGSRDAEIINDALSCRRTAKELAEEGRYIDTLERIVEALRIMREFSDIENLEFRALLVGLLFDLSEVHFELKDYKQSEKELEVLFRVLENLIKVDAERFGHYHIMAMELSTRILRSRKKTLELLVKQQLNAESLYDKVNSGIAAATDKLVDSLRNVGELLGATGDYRGAMKFYTEAIRLSKKRAGRVNRKEIKMSVELAKIMMRMKNMRARAQRLLGAVLPHAIALETIELEEDILALLQIIDTEEAQAAEQGWKAFWHKVQKSISRKKTTAPEESDQTVSNPGEESDQASEDSKEDRKEEGEEKPADENSGKSEKSKKKKKKK